VKELCIQTLPDGNIKPFSQEDMDKLKEYSAYQTLRCKVYGVRKQRSYQQLKMYWACCQTVADNSSHRMWNTKKSVDFQVRVLLHFVDADIVAVKPNGEVTFKYRSISFKELPHMEACNFFDRAFELMAKHLGITVETLLKNTEG
jgi:hypothetical protein